VALFFDVNEVVIVGNNYHVFVEKRREWGGCGKTARLQEMTGRGNVE